MQEMAYLPFMKAVQFVYSDRVSLNPDMAAEVLVLSLKLGLESLTRICEAYLVTHLQDEHLLDVFQYALEHHCQALAESAAHRILSLPDPAQQQVIVRALSAEQRGYLDNFP